MALVVGYRFDQESATWDASSVKDSHFKAYANELPDILGDEQSEEWTPALSYLHSQLGLDDDEEGKRKEELEVVIDTLHGTELSRIRREDKDDHSFTKREIVAKWLHLHGGF